MLSVIYINYYCTGFILQSIASLYQHGLQIPHEIIVVNNSPEDTTINDIKTAYPQTILLETGYNAGFSRANNKGIAIARGNIVVLLNPDTYVTDNSLEKLYQEFAAADFGACTLQLYFENGEKQLSAFYNVKGALNTLLPLPVIGTLLQQLNKLLGIKKTHISGKEQTPREVDWIHGACLMFKKEVIGKCGAMDEDFFLYSEEIEWCARIKKHYKIGFYGQYGLVHLEGKSSGQLFSNPQKGYFDLYSKKGLQLMLSNMVRIRKELGAFWFLFHITTYLLAIPIVFVAGIFKKSIHPIGYTKNIFYILRKSATILSGKPYFYKVL